MLGVSRVALLALLAVDAPLALFPLFWSNGHPEVNSRRYVLSADGRTLLASCNGCTLIDAATGKVERSFAREE